MRLPTFIKTFLSRTQVYTCVKTINGKENMVIDFERWEKEDVETFCAYICGEVNSSCVFEAYEYVIDLKIAFLNRKDAK